MKKNWIKIAGTTFGLAIALQCSPAFADEAEGTAATNITVEANVNQIDGWNETAHSLLNEVKTEGSEASSFLKNSMQTTSDKVKKGTGESLTAVNAKVGEAYDSMSTKVGTVLGNANGLVEESMKTEGKLTADAEGSISVVGSDFSTETDASLPYPTETVGNNVSEATSLVNGTKDTITQTAEHATHEVKGQVEESVDQSKDRLGELQTVAEKTVSSTEKKIDTTVGDLSSETLVTADVDAAANIEGSLENAGVLASDVTADTAASLAVKADEGSLNAQANVTAAVDRSIEAVAEYASENSAEVAGNVNITAGQSSVEVESTDGITTDLVTEAAAEASSPVTGSFNAETTVDGSVGPNTLNVNPDFETVGDMNSALGHVSAEEKAEATGEISA